MNKSLYSLILSDDVVSEIDKLAFRRGTNRSNMINRVLAEYVSMLTPEMRSDSIFHRIEQLVSEGDALVPYVTENSMSMTIKSSIEYKYRPTVKYEVQLYRTSDSAIGELNVVSELSRRRLSRRRRDSFLL